jgi:CheY-like chemotaxis protein
MSELAVREYGKSEGLNFIAEIRQAGTNLLSIINDILDFSKIEAGNLQINQAPYEAASLLNDVMAIIQVRMKEKSVRFISEIDPALPVMLEGDEARVRQILLNLLSNAVKYTDEGFIKFAVSGDRTGADMINLTFRVTDSGIGIKREDIAKLFGNFVRVDQRRNMGVEGSGLGLIIARSLCRAMGGDISVESEYGRGSIFSAIITQMISDDRPIGDIGGKINASPKSADVRFITPGTRVLIVDDIATNLMVIKGLLAPYEMSVSTCLNGKEAIGLIEREPFDIVFMDHMMPEMNGVEATHAIRALDGEYFKKVPIIALTANAISGMRDMFLQNGFSDYLAKPIEIPKLNEIMERWVPKEKRAEHEHVVRGLGPTPGFEIEGLDVSQGLTMTGGTVQGYIKVLELYARDVKERLKVLREAPDENGLALFVTQVHALKSASASIGAADLSKEAAVLEDAGRRGDVTAISGNLDGFCEALSGLAERIRYALSSREKRTGGEGTAIDRTALSRLTSALEAEDIGAVDNILNELRGMSSGGKTKELISGVSDHVLLADFKTAADMISEFLDGLDSEER